MRLLVFLTALVLFSFNGHAATATDGKARAEMMTKMMAAGTPGAPHKVLSDMAGEYTFTSKSWEAADSKPMEGKGQASMKMMLGGRWLEYTVNGEAAGEMPAFEGHGMMGYDNVKKQYQSIWMDSMSTGAMVGEGTFDAKSKMLKDAGTFSCPIDGKDRTYRGEWQMKDKKNMVYALYGAPMTDANGKEFKMMEMSFKRK